MTTISGDTGVDKVQSGTPITASSIMGALNASGTAPIYACRAWVNFNGTGTVAIRASGNVSSITDNGVGDYTVNFTIAMPDVNYSALCTIGLLSDGAQANHFGNIAGNIYTTSAIRVRDVNGTNVTTDPVIFNVSIFR